MAIKTTEIDGSKIRYFEVGTTKETLLLLHGLGASAERWESVIPLFAKKFRVIVPDLIGFGYSDKPMVDYTTDYFAEFVSKFVNKIGIKKMSIIGSSLGGQIAAESVINYDVNVKKLVLVSPSGIMKHSTPALNEYISAALYPDADSAMSAFQTMSGTKNIDDKIISGFIERMQLPNAKMAFMSHSLKLCQIFLISDHFIG